ncbi:hypothetical protein BC834DRAFT_819506, partial [Gloeopeniophorella convolvens]
LSQRLRGPHPLTQRTLSAFDEGDLDTVSYADIDMLNAIPREPTHAGYVVTGGSGFIGSHIVRLLLLRGETNVRILDLAPPPADLAAHPSVTYTKTDITSPGAVRTALLAPFPSGTVPSVIFHTAAAVRFWERAAYALPASRRVNVDGTAAVLAGAGALPPGAIFVHTSSAALALPRPRFMQLERDLHVPPWNKTTFADADAPLAAPALATTCYVRTKLEAERLVLAANAADGLRTGALRPGVAVVGPGDQVLSATLTMPRAPAFDGLWRHTNVCVWDAAAAHLALEDALRRDAAHVGGEAFLITGDGPAWSMDEVRAALQHYSSRTLVFNELSPLLVFALAHAVEALCFLRYYLFLPFCAVLGQRPRLAPRWLGELVFLQPASLDYLRDVTIDDSKARKMIGYKPQWKTAQTIKYTVDKIESAKGGVRHGLQPF